MTKPKLYDIVISQVNNINNDFMESIRNIYFVNNEELNRIKKELETKNKSIIETAPDDIITTKTQAFYEYCTKKGIVVTFKIEESKKHEE